VPSVIAVTAVARPQLEARVAEQERAPDAVVRSASVLSSGMAEALEAGPDWLWILDGTALPRPAALARLLERVGDHGDVPAPDALASAVLAADGSVATSHAPRFRRGETDLAMRAALVRMLPVRAARAGSLLVRADAARDAAPPPPDLDAPAAALAWTARMLHGGAGYLVPASLADAAPAPERAAEADVRAVAALLADGGFDLRERVWLAAETLGPAATAVRSRPGAVPALLSAAVRSRRADPVHP
jgi:hypothetical protein